MKETIFCVYGIEKSQRVDMYLSTLFGHLSRSYIQKCIDNEKISVNGKIIKKHIKVFQKDEIVFREDIISLDLLAENIPLDIIYEDESILIINKNPGINVHPTPGILGKKGTLVNAIMYHCEHQLPVISGEERPGIVHRLDKDTSGVMMIAKNDAMIHYLSGIIKNRKIKKYYKAVVVGIIKDTTFTIQSDIGRDSQDRTRMTVSRPLNPKYAITHAKVIGYFEDKYTLLDIDLETGRTHQIRVHLAGIGFPIVGDKVYGIQKDNLNAKKDYGVHRQMLHAERIELNLYGEEKKFIAPIKKDMRIFF